MPTWEDDLILDRGLRPPARRGLRPGGISDLWNRCARSIQWILITNHTKPLSGIEVGRTLTAGDIIATIADTRHSKANILPHLHLTLGIPSASFSYEGVVWNTIRRPEMMALLDPLAYFDGPYRALAAGNHDCRET